MHKSGFTLIELLVVIAIIALLAAILFPIFTSVQEHARQTKCLTNLRQLGVAFQGYYSDNNFIMPAVGSTNEYPNWCGCEGPDTAKCDPKNAQIYPYIKNIDIFLCPTDKNKKGKYISDPSQFPLSYIMNDQLCRVKIDAMACKSRSKMLLLVQEARGMPGSSSAVGINDGIFIPLAGYDRDVPCDVHFDGSSILYIDGHAKWASNKAMLKERNDGYWWPTYHGWTVCNHSLTGTAR